MTYEEALELFGLRRIPSEAVLKVLRNDAIKEAVEQRDEERQKQINKAFAVLIGKEEATLPAVGSGAGRTGPTGHVKAMCHENKDKPFVLEWQKLPSVLLRSSDTVLMKNPQRLEWDYSVDGYVRIDRTGNRFNYDDKDYSKADGSPFDPNSGTWGSGFEAEIVFAKDAPCPSCNAPHLQWCEKCDTIFCHRNKEDYPKKSYDCPQCGNSYGWGEGFGVAIKKVFDGKHLRSLTAEERKGLTNTKLLKK